MCNGRLVLRVLAVLSVIAAGFFALTLPVSAAPCPDKQVPAAAGKSCLSGGPAKGPSAPEPSPVDPAAPAPVDMPAPATGPNAGDPPSQESPSGQETVPDPAASAGPPSAATAAAAPAETASGPSRSARTLTTAPAESDTAGAGSAPMAGYLVALGGGMLLLSSVFGFMRFRPAAR
jgi:hypothetical protein